MRTSKNSRLMISRESSVTKLGHSDGSYLSLQLPCTAIHQFFDQVEAKKTASAIGQIKVAPPPIAVITCCHLKD